LKNCANTYGSPVIKKTSFLFQSVQIKMKCPKYMTCLELHMSEMKVHK
jgi:hypothetical protein